MTEEEMREREIVVLRLVRFRIRLVIET